MANPTMTLISAQTLATTAASVTFSSIPQNYNDLKLMVSARSTFATNFLYLQYQFNGDSATNYSYGYLGNYNGSVSTSNTASDSIVIGNDASGGSTTANIFGNSELYIANYKSTGSRQMAITGASEENSTTLQRVGTAAVLYRGSAAITSIVASTTASFAANSTFYLYGISNT